jgi:hypothetical protein
LPIGRQHSVSGSCAQPPQQRFELEARHSAAGAAFGYCRFERI